MIGGGHADHLNIKTSPFSVITWNIYSNTNRCLWERERERTNQKVRMFLVMKPAKFDAEHVSPSIYIFVNNCIYLTCTLDIKVYNNSYHNYEIHDVCWHLQTPRLIDYKLHFSLILCMSRMLMYKHCKWRGYCMRKISSQLFHWMVFLLLF